MFERKHILQVGILFALSALNVSGVNAQSIDDTQALIEFLNRPKLSPSDAATWATALPKLVGTYVTTTNDGKLRLIGKGIGTAPNPTQTDLKNRELYRALISSQQQVGASIVSFFKFSRDKKFVDELIVTDLISVTDPDFALDKCISNKPSGLTASTKYWCISGITLSGIQQRKFQKTGKIGSGNYGIVTADGNYAAQMDKQSMQLSASVSVIGPILNGNLIDPDPSPTVVKETVGVNPALPSPVSPPASAVAVTQSSVLSKILGGVFSSPAPATAPSPAPMGSKPQPAKRSGLEGAEIQVKSI